MEDHFGYSLLLLEETLFPALDGMALCGLSTEQTYEELHHFNASNEPSSYSVFLMPYFYMLLGMFLEKNKYQ